jgi:hypothetical protein
MPPPSSSPTAVRRAFPWRSCWRRQRHRQCTYDQIGNDTVGRSILRALRDVGRCGVRVRLAESNAGSTNRAQGSDSN